MSALREIVAKFGVDFDTGSLQRGNLAVNKTFKSLRALAGASGIGLVVKSLFDFVSSTGDQAIALDNQAAAIHMNVGELQRWQQAAKIAGASSDALGDALSRLSKSSARPSDELLRTADRLAAIEDPARRAEIGIGLFGSNYRELEPLLARGSRGMRVTIRDADDLAAVFSKDTVQASKAFRGELGKLTVFSGGLKTQLGAALLPVLTGLLKRFSSASIWIRRVTKDTQIFRVASMALVGGGLFKMINALGGLRKVLMLVSRQALTTILPLLALEDIFVFLSGGKSVTGELLDKFFGKGKADKIRKEIVSLFEELKTKPKEAVDRLLFWFGIDPTSKWRGFFEGFFKSLVDTLHATIDSFGDGWEGAKRLFGASWDGIRLIAKIAWTELKFGFLELAATVGDAFDSMWNKIISGAQGVVGIAEKAARAIGATDTAKSLAGTVKSLELNKGAANAQEIITRERDVERLRIVERAEEIGSRFTTNNTRSQTVIDAKSSVVVNVPPGTPAQTANRVANATSKALQKNNQATRAALVQGGG